MVANSWNLISANLKVFKGFTIQITWAFVLTTHRQRENNKQTQYSCNIAFNNIMKPNKSIGIHTIKTNYMYMIMIFVRKESKM